MKKPLAILFGSILLGIGINGFLVPYHLLDGGMIGIGLIVKYLWGIKAGLTIIALSIPIYIIAWFYFRNYFYSSLHGLLISSFFIDILAPFRENSLVFTMPILSGSIVGGILVGLGIGLMLRVGSSTGGTDLLAQFISKVTNYNVGIIIFIIDGFVLLLGSKTVGTESLVYSIIAVTVIGFTTTAITIDKEHERVY
ncbi:YitT family protein [Bacillus timonensis]|nr:YitT family protein [Bacillus timonensis]